LDHTVLLVTKNYQLSSICIHVQRSCNLNIVLAMVL